MALIEPVGRTAKETHVQRELDRLSAVVSDAQAAVDNLEGRLSTIIKPMVKEKEKDAPDEALVPLADRIRSVRRAVESMKSDLQDLINSCEL